MAFLHLLDAPPKCFINRIIQGGEGDSISKERCQTRQDLLSDDSPLSFTVNANTGRVKSTFFLFHFDVDMIDFFVLY